MTAKARKPYVESRRPRRQAAVIVRMAREERDALHRAAERQGMTVNSLVLAKVQPDITRELREVAE
jgi:hypothetical protein